MYNNFMNFRRYYEPGQIVFITQIVEGRRLVFDKPEMVALLRKVLHNVKVQHPFVMLGYVFLPDHFHLLIQPVGESNFSQIMHSLKFNFTIQYKREINYSNNLKFWQKRFWDHVIRDEGDFENHIHYIHYNPIKHGYVINLNGWENSSYLEWVERGAYAEDVEWHEPLKVSWGE